MNYGVRWEPGLAQQIRNGAIYNFSVDRFSAGERTMQYANAPPGFLYPGDAGFTNDKAGMENRWWQFSPRVGVAWDPKGDGRMSVRTGYSLSYDFVNAQFHLNTSVAPPFNAEARVDNPAGGFDNPWLGTGNETFFPVHGRPERDISADRALHFDSVGHQAAAPARLERQRSATDRREPGAFSDLSREAIPTVSGTCAR